jgi:recombinational DNA repair protein RecR
MSKMEQIQNEIRIITNKLEEHAESIDEVMMLLDYIEVVKRPESKVDELSEYIQNLKTKMEFILDLEITLEGDSFRSYLNLLRWPNQFK